MVVDHISFFKPVSVPGTWYIPSSVSSTRNVRTLRPQRRRSAHTHAACCGWREAQPTPRRLALSGLRIRVHALGLARRPQLPNPIGKRHLAHIRPTGHTLSRRRARGTRGVRTCYRVRRARQERTPPPLPAAESQSAYDRPIFAGGLLTCLRRASSVGSLRSPSTCRTRPTQSSAGWAQSASTRYCARVAIRVCRHEEYSWHLRLCSKRPMQPCYHRLRARIHARATSADGRARAARCHG